MLLVSSKCDTYVMINKGKEGIVSPDKRGKHLATT